MDKKPAIEVTNKDYDGLDEIYTHFFKCPSCKWSDLMVGSQYCGNCGVKLFWNHDPDELDNRK